MKGRSFK